MFIRSVKKRSIIALFLVVAFILPFIFFNNSTVFVDAGASKVYVVSSASIRGDEINQGDFMTTGGVYAESSRAVFDAKASRYARLLAKTRINNLKEYGRTELFEVSATFKFEKLVEGGMALFVFGLKQSRNGVGSADSGEVTFSYDYNNNCISIGVNEYKTEGVPTPVAEKHNYNMFSLNADITLKMKVDVNGKIYVSAECGESSVAAIDILSGKKLNIAPDGFVAFISQSTGESDENKNIFRISDILITAYNYDLVETVDHYLETFDKGSYNANMFYSQTTGSPISPAKIAVEDGKLVFRNVGQGYFTTREQYSNFELKFDIVDMYREGKKDGNGNIVKLISNWFMIGFGVDNYNDPPSHQVAATFLQFDGLPLDSPTSRSNHFTGEVEGVKDRYILFNNGNVVEGGIKSMSGDKSECIFSLWDKDYIGNEAVNLKFTVIDGVMTLYYKLASQTEYVMQYSYNIGTMQTGYIRIYSYGNGVGGSVSEYTGVLNMTIDNFEITNLDNDAVKLVKATPVYKSNVLPDTKDYAYTTVPDESDLLNNKLKNKDFIK